MNVDYLAQALLATEADAILAVDRGGTIRFWNPGAHRIFGFTAEEAMGQSLDLIVPESLRAQHNAGFTKTMASGVTHYGAGDLLAVPAHSKDGRRLSVEFTIVLLRDASGATEGAAAIMRDVTARFEEKRALRKQIATLSEKASTLEKLGRA
jgi:PAS domain S-box-containing protein